MQLTTGGSVLSRKLVQLITKYENLEFAVAWATVGTEVYQVFLKNRKKIRRAVIGTHFYQTHPDVLDDFVDYDEVRFMLQPQGVFHPKAYFFWNTEKWELLIGSANLTSGALGKNSELMVHLSSSDALPGLQSQIQAQINEYWIEGEVVTRESAKSYRSLWKAQQPALRRISGSYSSGDKTKAPVHTAIMSMPWPRFFKAVKADPHHGFNERCELLNVIKDAFRNNASYSEMGLGLRKTIAGLPNDFNEHWGWFGSMKGAGYFHQAVNRNNPYLSSALDMIPLDGAVDRSHYNAYVAEFIKAFPNGRHGVGVASRLLALKRPDYFVCFDAKNKVQLCKDFGIKQSGMTYDRYWEDIVTRILDSVWWNEAKPKGEKAARVWSGRAAMLDAIFYQP